MKKLIIAMSVLLMSVFFISSLLTSNTVRIKVDDREEAGLVALKRFNEVISNAWFERPYYEVIASSKNGPAICLNYNMGLKTLSISTDLMSGWDTSNKLTLEELRELSKQRYSTDSLVMEVGRFPEGYSDYETRSTDLLPLY